MIVLISTIQNLDKSGFRIPTVFSHLQNIVSVAVGQDSLACQAPGYPVSFRKQIALPVECEGRTLDFVNLLQGKHDCCWSSIQMAV